MYKARGTVAMRTIIGWPPKRAKVRPPIVCEHSVFLTSEIWLKLNSMNLFDKLKSGEDDDEEWRWRQVIGLVPISSLWENQYFIPWRCGDVFLPSVRPSHIFTSSCSSIYPSIHKSLHSSIHCPIPQFITHPPSLQLIHPFFINQSYLFTHPSVHQSIQLFTHPNILQKHRSWQSRWRWMEGDTQSKGRN